jgi:Protein of unknown function (DUF1236)
MRNNWLGTAAIALIIGTGSAFAQQSDLQQKRDEGGARSSLPSKGAERPAAREQRPGGPGGALNDRAAQREPGGAAEPRRGEMTPQREQAEDQRLRDKQPARQSQEQTGRERSTVGEAPQRQDAQGGRDRQQATEQKRPQGREDQQKQDRRALDSGKAAESKQQNQQQPRRGEPQTTGANQQNQQDQKGRAAEQKQPPGRERNDQAAQPPSSTETQAGRQPQTTGQGQQRETTGQAQDQSNRRTSMVNDQQRTQVIDRLQRERDSWRDTENVNIRVNIGERLPERVHPRPLPPDIVRIAPQYRDYEYTMIQDEIAIVDPRTHDVVDVIDEPGGSAGGYYHGRTRISLSSEQRELFRREALSAGSSTVGSTASGGGSGQTCLTLRPVPQDMARSNPDLANLSYVAVGDQVVLVDPRERRVVDVIDQDR